MNISVKHSEFNSAALSAPAAVSIIIPAFNERQNIETLTDRIAAVLTDISWEVIIVDDDSPDGTAEEARRLYRRDPRVRVIQRMGRRGLSSACIEGMLASSAPILAVMDADLQHDPALLPKMIAAIESGTADLVIGSRYVDGGGVGDWEQGRARASRLATKLAQSFTRVAVEDPMSGYFMVRRDIIDRHARDLSGIGFKILLDIILTCGSDLKVQEIPLQFGRREHGESKLSAGVAWEYLLLLADKISGGRIPVRFLAFSAIGGLGVGIHFSILAACLYGLSLGFGAAQAIATALTIVANFAINNVLTYSDRRLRGWRWFSGLASFALICGFGALSNVGIAAYLFGLHTSWAVAAFAGIAVSAVWNYGVSARYTWGSR